MKQATEKNGYLTPLCGHGEDGMCDCCLLAMAAHEMKDRKRKCEGCRQCLTPADFMALRFDKHWKISVRTEVERSTLLQAFRKAGFNATKEVFWHDYPGGAKCKGFTVAVTGKDKVLEVIMRSHSVTPIAWTGV